MVLLARYPEWQAQARDKVFQVFGNQNPNIDGLSKLKIVRITCFYLTIINDYNRLIKLIVGC